MGTSSWGLGEGNEMRNSRKVDQEGGNDWTVKKD